MRAVCKLSLVWFVVVLAGLPGRAAAQTNVVTFLDTNLATAVRIQLNLTNIPPVPITSSNMLALTALSASHRGITNLTGLEWATNLQCLDVGLNLVVDLSPLAGLTNLVDLWLQGNPVGNLGAITNLNRLSSLFLYNCGLVDVSPLSRMTNLSCLELRWNPLTNAGTALAGLTNLSRLYLGGTSVSNLGFVQNLTRLSLLNLDHDAVSGLSPLATLTNLSSLDLSYNPGADLAQIATLTNLTDLYVSGNSVSNLAAFANLRRLTSLTLYGNEVSDISLLIGLTNLSHLGLGWNPVTNFGTLAVLTNLAGLWLDGSALGNTASLTNALRGLTALKALGLSHDHLDDIGILTGLTNLVAVYADGNGLSSVQPLANLQNLERAQVAVNLLNVSPTSSVLGQIQYLQSKGVDVVYLPQNEPPSIAVAPGWTVASNATSSLQFSVWDDTTPSSQLVVTPSSWSNTNLLPSVVVSSSNSTRTLVVTTTNLTGLATINLRVTENVTPDSALSTDTMVVVRVVVPQTANIPDANLGNMICAELRKPASYRTNLTKLDLAELTELVSFNSHLSTLVGLDWACNLSMLFLERGAITNVAPLKNLRNLTYLSLYSNLVADVSPLAGLTNLTYLDLSWNPITNYAPLAGLSNLLELHLMGNSITNLSFLTNLSQLEILDLSSNRISDLSPLNALTNLSELHLDQNRLSNILSLTNLPALAYADLRLNLLDCGAMGPLTSKGVGVDCSPQRSPPLIDVRTNWLVPVNTDAVLTLSIADTGPPGQQFMVTARTLSPDLGVGLASNSPDTNGNWNLLLTNEVSSDAWRTVTLMAVNDVGLRTNTTVNVQIASVVPLTGQWFGDTNLIWTNYGNASWFGQDATTWGGYPAGQSGAIANNQASWLQTSVTGPGMLTFWWKVSSESNFDWLQFWVDGYTNRISGEVDWQRQVANVPPGLQTLNWRYSKDDGLSVGWDSAWLADVTFVPGIWMEMAGPLTNNQCRLVLHAIPGNFYEILVSTNLARWTSLAAIMPTNTATVFLDGNAGTSARFYVLRSLAPGALWLENQGWTNNAYRLIVHSPSNLPVSIQASTTLTNWVTLTTFTNTAGAAGFTDPQSTNIPYRFYRSLLPH